MKREISVLLASLLLLSGCGNSIVKSKSGESVTQCSEQKEELTAAAILDRVAASDKAEKMNVRAVYGSDEFDAACENLYGIGTDSITDGGVLFEETGQSADEVSVLKGSVESVLTSRAEQRAAVYDGYAPEEAEKARNAEVFTYEGFSVLIIADNAAEIKKIITG